MDNKALGKGLSALISGHQTKHEASPAEKPAMAVQGTVSTIETRLIDNNPIQPRTNYDPAALKELEASIKEKGILQPILIRPIHGRYQVVAGERRLRAARALGLQTVPAVIKEVSDEECLLLAVIENIQREELNVIEQAVAFQNLMNNYNLTQDQIAKSVGKNRATISNTLRLLNLPQDIQDQIATDQITMGHARALLSLNSEEEQLEMVQNIIDNDLSVRSVEGLVKQSSVKAPKKTKAQKAKDPDIASLEDELRRILGTKVIVEDKKGRGKLVIEYYTLDDLDRVLDILRKK
jgi:ParB family transcriptional regulator, chromosome partitioning protein